jgi:mannose-6-phosphate isomerase-like protein (cupin superfamily)
MSVPGPVRHFRDVTPRREDDCATHVVHSDLDGSGLELSVVLVEAGGTTRRAVSSGRDEVLYVAAGSGQIRVGDDHRPLAADTGALVDGPAGYELEAADTGLQVVVVGGRRAPGVACRDVVRTVEVAGQEKEPAVSNREFQVLFDPGRGCSGMTQFVGYVPKVRTPRHIHPYDEMLCVLRGHGTVEIGGHEVEVGPGDCYYLPQGCVHLVQNTQDDFLVELGVFTPAGSPTQNTRVE